MSLFQKSVIAKYLKFQNNEVVSARWKQYASHFLNPKVQEEIKELKEEQYQGEFLEDLFVKILGYTKPASSSETKFNLTTEYKNIKDSKKADGAIIIDSKVIAVIELKGCNTTDLSKIEAQAFNYKNNQPDCIYVITSNFEKIRLYIDNAIEHIEFNLFALTLEDFKLLYLCLSYDNISQNIAKKIKDESLSEEDVITKKLYKDYSVFKRELHQNLVQLNPDYDPLLLFKKSQKLLDRFLFLFFGEDRNLLPPNSVRLILSQWNQLRELDEYAPLYERFKKYFGYLNTGFKGKQHDVFAYNGGLFKPDEVLDAIKIDDEILFKHTTKLSEYDFASEVDVNILGHIFENSLNELDEIKAELEGTVIDKTKTKRKKDGVFYTPKYITKYIVENTVGKLCNEKKTELQIIEEEYLSDKKRTKATKLPLLEKLETYRKWLLQLTICDPACGSGAFLNQALDFLINEHKYIDELQAKLFGDALVLSDIENSILENNLFGVDLNDESVEIAKLSLWLRTAQPNRKLNDLNNNIKCGNSLIDDVEVAGDKAFNWHTSFPKVFEKGGFDVVIGNPPYVVLNAEDKSNEYFNKKYYVSKGGKTNLYKIFFESSIKLLKENGLLGFITPSNYLTSNDSIYLRKFLINNTKINDIVDYPESSNVFENVTQAVAILLIEKTKYDYTYVFNYTDKNINTSVIVNIDDIKNENKNIIKCENSLIKKLKKNKFIFNHFVDGFQGEVNVSTKKEFFKQVNSHEHMPLIRGNNIGRYILKQEVEEYCPTNVTNRLHYNVERIIFQEVSNAGISRRVNSIISANYLCGHTTNYIIAKNNALSLRFFIAILNSKLINYYFKYYNKTNHVPIGEIKSIPIFDIYSINQIHLIEKADQMLSLNKELQELSQKFQRTIQRKFELEDLSTKLQDWYKLSYPEFIKELAKKKVKLSLSQEAEWEEYFNQESKKALELKATIDATDKEIDRMVYELYELTEEEIAIVEQS